MSEKIKVLAQTDGTTAHKPVSDWWKEQKVIEVNGVVMHQHYGGGQINRRVLHTADDVCTLDWLDDDDLVAVLDAVG